MQRKALLLGAAILALAAAPALAADFTPPPVFIPPPPPAVQAHVDLYAGFYTTNFDGEEDESGFLFGGAGRANVPLQSGRNLQLDAQGSALVFTEGKFSESFPEFGGYAHWYARDPNSHALGLYAGADFFSIGPQIYTFGVEGQMYWPDFTLYGQASVSAVQGGDDGWMTQLRAEGQWFLSDDTLVVGDVMWSHLSADGDDANILTLLAQLEHRFNGGPFSGFVRGRFDHQSADFFDVDQFSAVLGVRVQADPPGSTEKSHRRTGPAMDVLPVYASQCIGVCMIAIP
jgi:hypothetical protein